MTIQYIMLVSLGFLIASLITLLLAPIFWHRAVRLTSNRLRQSLPLTEQEILADKDQLRAKYAIRVHQLEKQVEHATLGGARQKIDLNRRDASITTLETEIVGLKSELDENRNARSVLEQTVGDRIPKIESKLDEVRKLLVVRDREVAELSQSSRRQQEALNEARVINEKQSADVERLRAQVKAYEAQSRKGRRDADADSALAMRTELEMLRARTQDQVSLIDRLNAEITDARAATATAAAAKPPAMTGSGAPSANQEAETASLRKEIAALKAQLETAAKGVAVAVLPASHDAAAKAAAERDLAAIRAKTDDQAAEIARLRAELAAVTSEKAGGESEQASLQENRIALKARLSGLEAKSAEQAETIQRLRSELSQASQRSARQAESFVDEMRRLGVAAHVTQPRVGGAQANDARPLSVVQRTQKVLDDAKTAAQSPSVAGEAPPSAPAADQSAVVTPLMPAALGRRLTAGSRADADASSGQVQGGRVSPLIAALRNGQKGESAKGDNAKVGDTGADRPAEAGSGPSDDAADSPRNGASPSSSGSRQSRLLDRITAADAKGS